MHTADRQKMLNAQLLKQLILLVRQVCTAAKHHRADQSAVLLRQQRADFLADKVAKATWQGGHREAGWVVKAAGQKIALQVNAAGTIIAFAVKPVGGGDFGQRDYAGKLLVPVWHHIAAAPDLYVQGLTAFGLAVKQETGASGLQNRAGQRERTTGQVQSGFGKKTPVQKAKQQHESGGKGKNRGRPGTGGKKAE